MRTNRQGVQVAKLKVKGSGFLSFLSQLSRRRRIEQVGRWSHTEVPSTRRLAATLNLQGGCIPDKGVSGVWQCLAVFGHP
jgi:hypothetical protein